jgi:GMP synthase-like glutamine amidotransferase
VRVHWLQHASGDDLGCIEPWLHAQNHAVTRSGLHEGDALPSPDDFDALLVMGGAMNVDDEALHPWLIDEKRFLREVLAGGKRVLGICLGAQLIAEQLGAKVQRNAHREIGWFDVDLTDAGRAFAPMSGWPATVPMFHWHGYRFELPPAATRLAFSAACDQQAFALDQGRVIGLQFHPEVTSAGVRLWLEQGPPRQGPHVQPVERMREDLSRFASANTLLCELLEHWLAN